MTPLIRLGLAEFEPDPSGALWWEETATLMVADLHLEKGSSFARRGVLLPPYDTRATLERLAAVIERRRPARVVALGDSFHDAEGAARLDAADRAALDDLTSRVDWLWIAGNHDPGATQAESAVFDGIALRHAASGGGGPEISGHYHPKATIRIHGRTVTCRCFVSDGRRLILPAFGAYAGGLDVRDPAIAGWFPAGFTAHLAGTRRITAVPSALLGVPAQAALAV